MHTILSANKFRSFLYKFCFETKQNKNNKNRSHDDDEFISGDGDTNVDQTNEKLKSKFTNYYETLIKSFFFAKIS